MLPQGPYCGSQNHSHPMWPWTDDALSFLAVWLKRLPHFLSLQSLSRFLTIQRKAVQSRAEQRSWAKFLFLSLSKFLFLAFCIWLWSLESRKERFLITRPSVSLQGLCPFLLFFFFYPSWSRFEPPFYGFPSLINGSPARFFFVWEVEGLLLMVFFRLLHFLCYVWYVLFSSSYWKFCRKILVKMREYVSRLWFVWYSVFYF